MGINRGRRVDEDIKIYTPKELAEMWGCTTQNIYKLINKGRLPARRMGRKIVIRKKDLINYLDSLPYVRDLRID